MKRDDGRFVTPVSNGELPEDAYGGLELSDPDFVEKFCKNNKIKFVDTTEKESAR